MDNKSSHVRELEALLSTVETREEVIEVLTAYIQEQEKILDAGGMTVPKRRNIVRKIRTARAILRRVLSPPSTGRRKRESPKAVIANYLQKVETLLGVANTKGRT